MHDLQTLAGHRTQVDPFCDTNQVSSGNRSHIGHTNKSYWIVTVQDLSKLDSVDDASWCPLVETLRRQRM